MPPRPPIGPHRRATPSRISLGLTDRPSIGLANLRTAVQLERAADEPLSSGLAQLIQRGPTPAGPSDHPQTHGSSVRAQPDQLRVITLRHPHMRTQATVSSITAEHNRSDREPGQAPVREARRNHRPPGARPSPDHSRGRRRSAEDEPALPPVRPTSETPGRRSTRPTRTRPTPAPARTRHEHPRRCSTRPTQPAGHRAARTGVIAFCRRWPESHSRSSGRHLARARGSRSTRCGPALRPGRQCGTRHRRDSTDPPPATAAAGPAPLIRRLILGNHGSRVVIRGRPTYRYRPESLPRIVDIPLDGITRSGKRWIFGKPRQ